jgi:hypothetical protein
MYEYLTKKNYSKETENIISKINDNLDLCIKKMKKKDSEESLAFVRLNTRSPKDALSNYPKKIEKALSTFMYEPFNTINLLDDKGNLLYTDKEEYFLSQNNALIEIRKLITIGKSIYTKF